MDLERHATGGGLLKSQPLGLDLGVEVASYAIDRVVGALHCPIVRSAVTPAPGPAWPGGRTRSPARTGASPASVIIGSGRVPLSTDRL